METDYLKEYVTLAELQNFMEAADALYMSQSTLSRHIKTMEESLGVTLFDRTTRKVSNSGAGEIFLPYARRMVALQEDCERALRDHSTTLLQTLEVGAFPSMAQYHITDIVAAFQKENPDIMINLHAHDSVRLTEKIEEGVYNFAFIREHADSQSVMERLPFALDHLATILPVSHALAKEHSVSLSSIKEERFLLLNKGTMMHSLCVRACKENGFSPNVVFTDDRAENIMDLVAGGMGIALLTKRPALKYDSPQIAIVDIEPLYTTPIHLTWTKGRTLTEAEQRFVAFVEERKLS